MLSQPRPNPVGSKVTQHHPQFQRAKAAAELDPGVHKIADARRLSRLEVLGREGEGGADGVHSTTEKGA